RSICGSNRAGASSVNAPAMTPGATRLKRFSRTDWPPSPLNPADDVLLRNVAPVTAVGTVIPMIAQHKVIPFRDHFRSPVVVASEFLRHERIGPLEAIDEDGPGGDPDLVSFGRDHPFDEYFLGIVRVVEHHDVVAPGIPSLIGQ